MKVLLVEDDQRLAAVIRRGLREAGHVVDVEHDGDAGERSALGGDYDAIVLDLTLPVKDGIAVTRDLRRAQIATPILMLTSRDTVDDTILGLDAGADDYLRKPFVFGELQARLRSLSRRRSPPSADRLQVADCTMDVATREVRRGERLVPLTARETAFLEFFMRNAGRVLSQQTIENALWERDRDTVSNLIRVYVRRLRAKLSAKGEPELIHTIRGGGYRMSEGAEGA